MSELTAGRELDAMIAEKVMGFSVIDVDCCANFYLGWYQYLGTSIQYPTRQGKYIDCGERRAGMPHVAIIPAYSTDIAAAWRVVEKMRERGFVWEVINCIPKSIPPFAASFVPISVTGAEYEYNRDLREDAAAFAATAPLAICLAALKAVAK